MPKETNSTFLPPRILGKRLVTAEHLKTQKAYDQYQKYYEKYTDTQKQEVDKYKEECIKVQKIIGTLTLEIKQDITDIDFLKLHARAWTISNSNILQTLQQIVDLQKSNQKSKQKKEMSASSNQLQVTASNTEEVLKILASIEKDYPEHITIPLHNAFVAIITLITDCP